MGWYRALPRPSPSHPLTSDTLTFRGSTQEELPAHRWRTVDPKLLARSGISADTLHAQGLGALHDAAAAAAAAAEGDDDGGGGPTPVRDRWLLARRIMALNYLRGNPGATGPTGLPGGGGGSGGGGSHMSPRPATSGTSAVSRLGTSTFFPSGSSRPRTSDGPGSGAARAGAGAGNPMGGALPLPGAGGALVGKAFGGAGAGGGGAGGGGLKNFGARLTQGANTSNMGTRTHRKSDASAAAHQESPEMRERRKLDAVYNASTRNLDDSMETEGKVKRLLGGWRAGGWGLHLSASQLNLSRVCHKKAPYTPYTPPNTRLTRAT